MATGLIQNVIEKSGRTTKELTDDEWALCAQYLTPAELTALRVASGSNEILRDQSFSKAARDSKIPNSSIYTREDINETSRLPNSRDGAAITKLREDNTRKRYPKRTNQAILIIGLDFGNSYT
jgi:hypothetical protein